MRAVTYHGGGGPPPSAEAREHMMAAVGLVKNHPFIARAVPLQVSEAVAP